MTTTPNTTRVCLACGREFVTFASVKRKTCSDKCLMALRSSNATEFIQWRRERQAERARRAG